jgi:heptaprenyl diphosphate synthase
VTTAALLAAGGIALFVVESYIPTPLPFMKIGLANISSLLALLLEGPAVMLLVVVTRVLVGSLLVGSFLSPAFVIAITAGIAASLAMALVHRVAPTLFSAVGLSLIGSMVHVLTQLAVVGMLIVQTTAVYALLPALLLTGSVGGIIVGYLSAKVMRVLPAARLNE